MRDDTYIQPNKYKPILSQSRWHSVDNMLSNKPQSKLVAISEVPSEVDRSGHFRNVFRTELNESTSHAMYRYYADPPGASTQRCDVPERPARSTDKNKVTFSNTVTVAVVSVSDFNFIDIMPPALLLCEWWSSG